MARRYLAAQKGDAKKKKKIQVPEGTTLLPPKTGETLSGVKQDRFGNVLKASYSKPRVTINGVRATTSQVRFVQPKEAAERSDATPSSPWPNCGPNTQILGNLSSQNIKIGAQLFEAKEL